MTGDHHHYLEYLESTMSQQFTPTKRIAVLLICGENFLGFNQWANWGWQPWKRGWMGCRDRLFDLGFRGLDHHIGILGLGVSEQKKR